MYKSRPDSASASINYLRAERGLINSVNRLQLWFRIIDQEELPAEAQLKIQSSRLISDGTARLHLKHRAAIRKLKSHLLPFLDMFLHTVLVPHVAVITAPLDRVIV